MARSSKSVVQIKSGDKLPSGAFGFVGTDRWDVLSNGRLGIIRNITEDRDENSLTSIGFVAPSTSPGRFAWRPGAVSGTYENDVGTDRAPSDLSTYGTLFKFGTQLQTDLRSRGRLSPDDERLKLLDSIVEELIRSVAAVHKSGRTVGLLNPESIVFFLEEGELRLILPDVGFLWRGSPPGPKWIESLDDGWGELWHPVAADVFQRRGFDSAAQQQDVVLLGRILFWILTGEKTEMEASLRKRFFQTTREDSGQQAFCWQTLFQVLAAKKDTESFKLDQINTLEKLWQKLRQNKLSEHFIYRKPKPKRLAIPWARLIGLLLGLSVLSTGGYYLMDWFRQVEPPSILCPECKAPSPLVPQLMELEPVFDQIKKQLDTMASAPKSLDEESIRRLLDLYDESRRLIIGISEVADAKKVVETSCVSKLSAKHLSFLDQLGKAFVIRAVDKDAFGDRHEDLALEIANHYVTWREKFPESKTTEDPPWLKQIQNLYQL